MTQHSEEQKRRQLKPSLSTSSVFAIALGSSIGWGAFILPGDWIKTAGPFGAMIGLLIGAIIMMIIAANYGILIEKHPVSGGGFTYAYLAGGKIWAFVAGWFLSLGYISIVALNASAFSLLLKFLLPDIMQQGYLYTVAGWDVFLPEVIVSSILIILFAVLNTFGTAFSGKLQFYFSMALLIGVFALGGFTFQFATEPLANMAPLFKESQPIWVSIILILAIAPWAYVGFDNVPQAAEEFDFSPKKAAGLMIFSLAATFLVYAIMIGVTSWSFAAGDLPEDSLWLTGTIINKLLGTTGVVVLAIAIMMGIFTGLNGFYMSSSRLLFAMARARALPNFFRTLSKRKKTPLWGIWFVTLMTLPTPWLGRQALTWIVDMSSMGVSVAYFFASLAAFRLLAWRADHTQRPARPLYKLFAIIGMIASLAFLALLLVPASPASLSTPSYILLAGWVVMGIIFYLIIQKRYNSLTAEETEHYILGKELQQ